MSVQNEIVWSETYIKDNNELTFQIRVWGPHYVCEWVSEGKATTWGVSSFAKSYNMAQYLVEMNVQDGWRLAEKVAN